MAAESTAVEHRRSDGISRTGNGRPLGATEQPHLHETGIRRAGRRRMKNGPLPIERRRIPWRTNQEPNVFGGLPGVLFKMGAEHAMNGHRGQTSARHAPDHDCCNPLRHQLSYRHNSEIALAGPATFSS